jgi:hypothetical protein
MYRVSGILRGPSERGRPYEWHLPAESPDVALAAALDRARLEFGAHLVDVSVVVLGPPVEATTLDGMAETDRQVLKEVLGLDPGAWLDFKPSTDIGHAMYVVTWMRQHGFKFVLADTSISGVAAASGPWAFFGRSRERVRPIPGSTFEIAICLAAVEAVKASRV